MDLSTTALRELPCIEPFGLVWAHAEADPGRGVDLDAHLGAALVDELDSYGFDTFHHVDWRT